MDGKEPLLFDHTHYVPILRGKQGELWALSELGSDAHEGLTPLIEAPYLEANGDPDQADGVNPGLVRLPKNLKRFWGDDTFFLDLGLVASDPSLADGDHPVDFVFGEGRRQGLAAIPVTDLRRDDDHQAAIARVVQEDKRGFCVRLDSDDFDEIDESVDALGDLMAEIDSSRADVDIVLDLGDIESRQVGSLALAVQGLIQALPSIEEWRTLTLASTSFPSVRDFSADTVTPTPRADWSLWRRLLRKDLPRNPTFGDYGTVGAQTAEPGTPQIFAPSPNLRYTTDDEYVVFKARHPRHGHDQFNDLCAALVRRSDYAGPDFSWADGYINRCAQGTDGPGNATKWVQVGTNHHLEAVVSQIASLDA